MAKNTKTPVMILQELAVKRNTVPEYELIYCKQGTHNNEFHYQVSMLQEQAVGVGRSKKEAKHEAASKALEYLAERGIVHPDMPNECTPSRDIRHEHVQTKAPINCIPKLLDICVENKIPLADFFEISAVGPPHCREFTYECRIKSIVTRATAGSKKHAKQLAAKDMLNKIMNVIPELQQEYDEFMLTQHENEVIEKYTALSKYVPGKVNFNSKVIEYDLHFKTIMTDMCIDLQTVMKIFEMPPSEDVLQRFANIFDLEYERKVIQENPPIVILNINSETPITVMETSSSLEEATDLAVQKMFLILQALLVEARN